MKGEERKEEKKGIEEEKREVINVNANSAQTSISQFLFRVHLLLFSLKMPHASSMEIFSKCNRKLRPASICFEFCLGTEFSVR